MAMIDPQESGSSHEMPSGMSTPTLEEQDMAYVTPATSPSQAPGPMTGTTAASTESPKSDTQPFPSLACRPSTSSSLRYRTARQAGDGDNAEGYPQCDEKAPQVEEYTGLIRRTPFFRSPIKGGSDSEQWHHSIDRPSQWTSLFYGTPGCYTP
jgi:hypothetical protein